MIFTKLRVAAAAAILAVVATLGGALYLQTSRLEKARLEASAASQRASALETELAAQQRANKALQAARRKADQRATQAQKELNEALTQSREWADAPVPPGVAEWLREHG